MSSFTRRIQLKIMRSKGLLKPRYKAVNKYKGMPYRNCRVFKNAEGEITHWIRYH